MPVEATDGYGRAPRLVVGIDLAGGISLALQTVALDGEAWTQIGTVAEGPDLEDIRHQVRARSAKRTEFQRLLAESGLVESPVYALLQASLLDAMIRQAYEPDPEGALQPPGTEPGADAMRQCPEDGEVPRWLG